MSKMDDKSLQDALEQVRGNHEEAEKFAADPAAYLQSKGVNTEGLKLTPFTSDELSNAELELAAGGMTDEEIAPKACSSAGDIQDGKRVCVTVGDALA